MHTCVNKHKKFTDRKKCSDNLSKLGKHINHEGRQYLYHHMCKQANKQKKTLMGRKVWIVQQNQENIWNIEEDKSHKELEK